MKPIYISEHLLHQLEEQQELLEQFKSALESQETLIGSCHPPKRAARLLEHAFQEALQGNVEESYISEWFGFYVDLIEQHFHPLKRNALLLDVQLIKKELLAYLKGIAQLKEASEATQKVVRDFNASAYEVIVAALLKTFNIEVAHYPFSIDWDNLSEKEILRIKSDFEVFKSIQKNCLIFVRSMIQDDCLSEGNRIALIQGSDLY